MNIVFSTDTLSRGGKERQLCLLFSKLPGEKFRKLIFSKKRNYESDNNYLSEYGITEKSVSLFGNYREYRELIKEHKPDAVFSWDGITSLYNLMLFKKYNYFFINGNIRHGIRLFKSSHFFRSFILWLSPYVVANSVAGLNANNLEANDRNFVLYNGINIPELKFLTREEKRKLRKEIFPGRNTGNLFFISVANFMPVKDYFTVIKALSELKKRISFEYLIIGDGPLRNQIQEELQKSGLSENTHLIGRVSDIKKYLDISDIYIHSSKGEGISNTILEAMMAGLPVVSTDVGGVRETVYEKTSFLFKYEDTDGLKNCIINALDILDKDFSNDENYVKHLEKFSAENMVKNFYSILNKITDKEK